MRRRVRGALPKASGLSPDIAKRLLTELEDEQAWKARFATTTDEQWDRLAAMVRQEISAGDISPLDDILPSERLSRV